MVISMTFASAFAGIAGFDIGFERAGAECVHQTEINPFRLAVLQHHYPHVPKGEDIRDVHGRDINNPDVYVGGFPCKDLSRGKSHRLGLAGQRSALYWEWQRLAAEALRVVGESRPRWTVLENVSDLTSSNDGRDLAAVLLGLEQLGYGWAYRVVDARDFGSLQKRVRTIIVGHLGGDPRPAWSVLADTVRRGVNLEVRPESSGWELTEPDPATRVYRKSARPRGKAEEGNYATYVESPFYNVLTENDSRSNAMQTHIVEQDGRLRALTPVEWERLSGFPDGWTKPAGEPKNRMAALGESMHVNMATALAQSLVAAHQPGYELFV